MRFVESFVTGFIGLVAYILGSLDVLGFRESSSEGSILLSLGVVASVVSRLAWRVRND